MQMSPRAKIAEVRHGVAAINDLLDIRGFNLNAMLEIKPEFLNDVNHEHDDVSSFVFGEKRPLDLVRIEDFLGAIVQAYGTNMMRYKGALSVARENCRMVFQGVHMLTGSEARSAWKPAEPRESKRVFVGRNVPKEVLLDGLQQCDAGATRKQAVVPVHLSPLRPRHIDPLPALPAGDAHQVSHADLGAAAGHAWTAGVCETRRLMPGFCK